MNDISIRDILDVMKHRKFTGDVFQESCRESAVKILNGHIHLQTNCHNHGIGIRLIKNGRSAFFSTSNPSPDTLDQILARLSDPTESAPLIPRFELPQPIGYPLITGTTDPHYTPHINDRQIRPLLNLDHAIRAASSKSVHISIFFTQQHQEIGLLNTHHLEARHTRTRYTHQIRVVQTHGRHHTIHDDFRVMAAYTNPASDILMEISRCIPQPWRIQSIPRSRGAVILHPNAGRAFITGLLPCFNGWHINHKQSVLAGLNSQPIASESVTLTADACRNHSPFSCPFDGEGLPSRSFDLIQNGFLCGFFDSITTALESGRVPGSTIRNSRIPPHIGWMEVIMKPGPASPEEIISESDGAVYITRLIGINVDIITGDFSAGAAGRIIEKGKLGPAISRTIICGNALDLLRRIDRIGNDLTYRQSINCPTFRIGEITVSGE